MSEQTTVERTGAESTEERPRCLVGNKTKRPCWREGTKLAWPDAPDYVVCDEHYRAIQLGHKVASCATT